MRAAGDVIAVLEDETPDGRTEYSYLHWTWSDRNGYQPVGKPKAAANLMAVRLTLNAKGYRPIRGSDAVTRPPRKYGTRRTLEQWA